MSIPRIGGFVLALFAAMIKHATADPGWTYAIPATPPPAIRHDSIDPAIRVHRLPERPVTPASINVKVRETFEFGTTDDEGADDVVFYTRQKATYRFDLATAQRTRILHRPLPAPFDVSGHVAVYVMPPMDDPSFAAVDLETGRTLWSKRGWLIGVGSGAVLANVTESRRMAAFSVSTGLRRWEEPSGLCMPQQPAYIFRTWAVMNWAYACGVSANSPFFMFVRMRDGWFDEMTDATALLAVHGNTIFLTGDNRHYGEFGPGNFSVWDARTAKRHSYVRIHPDEPRSIEIAFSIAPSRYALANALYVQLVYQYHAVSGLNHAYAVYRYELRGRSAPVRFLASVGVWLGAAIDNETYFARNGKLIKVIERSNHVADSYPFAGSIDHAQEAIAHGDRVYVRDGDGRINVFNRWTRVKERSVNAHCDGLIRIRKEARLTYAFCRDSDMATSVVGWLSAPK